MKVHLPNSAYLGNIDPFLRGFDPARPEKLEITANARWVSVHPAVLCMIAALGLNLKSQNIYCEKFTAKSKNYFERIGFFKILKIKSEIKITSRESAGRFIPLTQVRNDDELADFVREMIPLLHLEIEQARALGYVISELVRNVLEHSGAPNGAVLCAQYYKKSNSIRIGIADTGQGICKSIRQSYPKTTELEAIRLALMPGVTGTTQREGGTEQNAGAGLFFIKSIAALSRDYFMIYSGRALFKLLKKKGRLTLQADPFKDHHSKDEKLPPWPGTLVGLDISLEQTVEFAELLGSITEVYSAAVRERRSARYKKPKFI